MKQLFIRLLAASLVTVPAWASAHGGGSQGSGATIGSAAVTSSSTASASGGAGGAGGSAAGGSATGGAATGGAATGGAANGGSASGNTSNVTVSMTAGVGSGDGSGSAPSGTSTQAVDYGGSYTVKTAPQIVAPSLTSTFSDTCMGSSSFGLSVVGFGATGGTTMVDDACVRRLDSREFRAMGMVDVALALLCQSPANRKAVESTGRACPSATPPAGPVASAARPADQVSDPFVRRRMGLDPAEAVATSAAATTVTAAATQTTTPASAPSAAAVTTAEAPDNAVTVSSVTRSEPEVEQLKEVATGTGN